MRDEARSKHLAWCKERALEYARQGDNVQAMASLTSDLRKHPSTVDHVAPELGMRLMMSGHLKTTEAMVEFINGVN